MRKLIIELTIFQSSFIIAWLLIRTAPWFFVALALCLLATASIAIYLLIKWRWLPGSDRREGVLAVAGWMVMAWLVVKANGLTVMSLLG